MADFFEQLGKKISEARSVLWIVPMKEITSKSERRFIKNSKQEKWRT